MQEYQIIISKLARNDLFELLTYIVENDIPGKAFVLRDELLNKCESLSELPERGKYIYKYDSLIFYTIYYKVYQIIYTVLGNEVTISGVLDGRRDLQKLLPKRFADFITELD